MGVAWPADVPSSVNKASYTQKLQDNLLRFKPDVGPSKARPRQVRGVEAVSFSVQMNNNDILAFEIYFFDELVGGFLAFDFNDPITGVTGEYRFKEPPVYTEAGVDSWNVLFRLEKL